MSEETKKKKLDVQKFALAELFQQVCQTEIKKLIRKEVKRLIKERLDGFYFSQIMPNEEEIDTIIIEVLKQKGWK